MWLTQDHKIVIKGVIMQVSKSTGLTLMTGACALYSLIWYLDYPGGPITIMQKMGLGPCYVAFVFGMKIFLENARKPAVATSPSSLSKVQQQPDFLQA